MSTPECLPNIMILLLLLCPHPSSSSTDFLVWGVCSPFLLYLVGTGCQRNRHFLADFRTQSNRRRKASQQVLLGVGTARPRSEASQLLTLHTVKVCPRQLTLGSELPEALQVVPIHALQGCGWVCRSWECFRCLSLEAERFFFFFFLSRSGVRISILLDSSSILFLEGNGYQVSFAF